MKTTIVIVIIFLLFVGGGMYWFLFRKEPGQKDSPAGQAFDVLTGLQAVEKKAEADPKLAFARAKELYKQKLLEETDFSRGPCLSNEIIPGWVADIAHNPRESIDDLPENQCAAYREGKARHFIELDPYGNLIRAQ